MIDVARLAPQLARPHEPDDVVTVASARGTPVDMVFIGTCTGGRTRDFHQVLEVLNAGGGVASGVMLVITPAMSATRCCSTSCATARSSNSREWAR